MTNQNAAAAIVAMMQSIVDRQEAARRARIEGSKTNFDYLLAVGVITTCDDEMERSYRWEHRTNLAKEAGVSFDLISQAEDFRQLFDAVVGDLKTVVFQNETHAARSARWAAAVAGLKGIRTDRKTGKQSVCKHNETKKERGLMRIGGSGRDNVIDYVCCRCGAELKFQDAVAGEPSAEVREAEELLTFAMNGGAAE